MKSEQNNSIKITIIQMNFFLTFLKKKCKQVIQLN